MTLCFPERGIAALVGPNGAGKTTLLNVLTGFVRADWGEVYLGDKRVTNLPPHTIARLGITRSFQDLRILANLTIFDNVALAFGRQAG